MTPLAEQWWRRYRVVGDVTVIHLDLSANTDHEQEALAWLDHNERDRWNRFLVDRAKRQFALCRAALRANLCDRLGCANDRLAFGAREFGKPFAIVDGVPAAASFNVSHSGTHGLIAFAPRGQLGIDVEERLPRRDLDGIAETVFGPRERAAIAKLDGGRKVRLFFTLWTIKEALIKAIGTGFSLDPKGFEVPPPMLHGTQSATFRFPREPGVPWRINDLGEARFAAALACEWDPRDNSGPR